MRVLDVIYDYTDDIFFMISGMREDTIQLTILDDNMHPTKDYIHRSKTLLWNQQLDGDVEVMRRYS